MNLQTPRARTIARPARFQATATTALLGIAVMLPMIVHQVPAVGVAPWGARLLAMFIAPFVCVVLFRLHVALIPAILAPAVNYLLFGTPIGALVSLITIELVVFTVGAFLLMKVNRRFWIAGPTAYVVAKGVSGMLIATTGLFEVVAPAGAFVLGSIAVGVPGLVLLTGLHVLLVRDEARVEG